LLMTDLATMPVRLERLMMRPPKQRGSGHGGCCLWKG
jgi:hypothetical protein